MIVLPLKHQDMLIRNSIRKRHLVKTMAVWRHEKKKKKHLMDYCRGNLMKAYSRHGRKNISLKTKRMKIGVKLNSLLLNYVNTVGGNLIKKINASDRHKAFTLHQLIYFASASFKMCFNLVPDHFFLQSTFD